LVLGSLWLGVLVGVPEALAEGHIGGHLVRAIRVVPVEHGAVWLQPEQLEPPRRST
jgi:hypothetical protein